MRYWYRDHWNGGLHEFASLRAAKAAAKQECGVSLTIHDRTTGNIVCFAPASGYSYP